jgi:hypothetical protein
MSWKQNFEANPVFLQPFLKFLTETKAKDYESLQARYQSSIQPPTSSLFTF